MNPYREYFIWNEKLADLGDTVGVTKAQWDIVHSTFNEALEACEEIEKRADMVTVTIKRDLAETLAFDWVPCDDHDDDPDPMRELFDKCREEIIMLKHEALPRHTLVGGDVLVNVHDPSKCKGEACCIHNPSDHHMVTWRQNWRSDRRIMERICPHGIGHPDPDDPKTSDKYEAVHGCDGCCRA